MSIKSPKRVELNNGPAGQATQKKKESPTPAISNEKQMGFGGDTRNEQYYRSTLMTRKPNKKGG